MSKFRYVVLVMAILGMVYFPKTGWSDTKSIEDRLNELEQEVKVLKRQLELKKEDEAKRNTEYPIITASAKDGFSIKSPDDNFKLRLRGLLQVDSRTFTDNKKDLGYNDTFSIRRARPIFEGTVARDFDFYVMPDFGSNSAQLVDGWLEYKYFPKAKIKAGKFKAPLGLERLQSDSVANFVETGFPGNIVPNRDVGVQLSGDVLNNTVNYAFGYFNGGADGSNVADTDNNNDKDVIARVFVQPFKNSDTALVKGLGIGIAGSYGHKESSTVPTYKSPGQATVFSYASGVTADGANARLSPQFYYYYNSLGLLGEFVTSDQKLARVSGGNIFRERFKNKAWQISGNYVLTGENASFRGFTPKKPFSLKDGTWGAFDVVGRYGKLDVDDEAFDTGFASLNTAVSSETAWGLGLNWYLNNNLRLMLDFEHTDFDRGAVSGEDRKSENVVFTRFQVTY